jgi:hypothetical protein
MKKGILSFALILSQIILQAQIINVSTTTELQNALTAAQPGQTIVLAPGTYYKSGGFSVPVGVAGTKNQPITVQGSSSTTLTSNNLLSGYGFYLKGKNDYWILDGFTVRNSAKGIVTDSSCHTIIRNVSVHFIGAEGIHFRSFSSYNTLENSFIDSTGRDMSTNGAWEKGFAEGLYIGSASSNWSTYTKGKPDTSNYNIITGVVFGDSIPSENIDIKEGTRYGSISNCTFNGKGLNGANSADSWIDAKGDYWTIECNTGAVAKGLKGTLTNANGFQDHENTVSSVVYGHNNIFSNNQANVAATQYAFYLHKSGMSTICNNNTVSGGGSLFSGTLTNCVNANSCITTGINNISMKEEIALFPNPASDYIQINFTGKNTAYLITDIIGKIVKTGNLSASNSIVDISELHNGLYFIHIEGSSVKFIKQ